MIGHILLKKIAHHLITNLTKINKTLNTVNITHTFFKNIRSYVYSLISNAQFQNESRFELSYILHNITNEINFFISRHGPCL